MDKNKISKASGFSKSSKSGKFFTNIIVAILIFGFGWYVGNGRIQFGSINNSGNTNLPNRLDYSSVNAVYDSLKTKYDGELKEEDLIEGMKAGLVKAAGDPYTEYMSSEAAKSFSSSLEGKFEGIGAELGKDKDNNIIIISPIAGYPAEKAGIQPKDLIAEINGESAYDITISEAVEKIRGEKGTEVSLKIIRKGEVKDIKIIREEINIPSVKYEVRDGTGILTISRFGDDTVKLAREAADEFAKANVDGVVLDLRGNTGGYLSGAVDISSLWLDNGSTILTERRGDVVVETFKAKGSPKLKGIKTVVLVNEGSASASEIVAGALKDNGVATLIGEKTYGKGSVQQPIDLKDGGLLKVTIARWYTPSGKNIDKEGIEPDTKVDLSSDDITSDRDPQLDEALKQVR